MEPEETKRAAIGRNADYYLGRWAKMDSSGSAVSWNWAACLLNLFWFAWRKMWLVLVLFLIANVVLGLAGAAVPALGSYIHLPMIGLTFITGAYGNYLYRRKIERLAAETGPSDDPAALDRLRRRGGTSPLALAVTLLLAVAAIAAAVVQQAQQMEAAKAAE
jgi:hypothetical protein